MSSSRQARRSLVIWYSSSRPARWLSAGETMRGDTRGGSFVANLALAADGGRVLIWHGPHPFGFAVTLAQTRPARGTVGAHARRVCSSVSHHAAEAEAARDAVPARLTDRRGFETRARQQARNKVYISP